MPLTKYFIHVNNNEYGSLSFREAPIFFAGYSIWLTVALLNTTQLSEYFGHNNYFYVLTVLLLFVHEICLIKTYSIIDWLFLLVLLVINIQTYLIGNNDLIAFSLLLFCGRRIAFQAIAKLTIILQISLSVMVIVLCLLGVVSDKLNIRPDGTIRHSLGFAYVTYLSYVFLNVVLLWLFLRKKNVTYIELSVMVIINSLILIFTDARNGCGLIYFTLICAFILKVTSFRIPKVILPIFKYLFIIAPLAYFIILAMYAYNSHAQLMIWIDDFFSKRLTYSEYAISNFGLPIIGGTSSDLVKSGLVIDSSYLRIVYEHGLLVLLLILYLFTLLMRYAIQLQDYWLMLALVIIAIHSLFDAQLISFQHNTFLFMLALPIFSINNTLNVPHHSQSYVGNIINKVES